MKKFFYCLAQKVAVRLLVQLLLKLLSMAFNYPRLSTFKV